MKTSRQGHSCLVKGHNSAQPPFVFIQIEVHTSALLTKALSVGAGNNGKKKRNNSLFPSCWVLIICPICHHIKGFILEQDINRLTGKLVLCCSFLYTHQHLQIRQIGGQQVLPRLPRQKRFYLRVFVCVFGLETTGCEVTGCTLMKGPEH